MGEESRSDCIESTFGINLSSFTCCYVLLELFVSKYLSGVPVNWLNKLSALSTINKPLNVRGEQMRFV